MIISITQYPIQQINDMFSMWCISDTVPNEILAMIVGIYMKDVLDPSICDHTMSIDDDDRFVAIKPVSNSMCAMHLVSKGFSKLYDALILSFHKSYQVLNRCIDLPIYYHNLIDMSGRMTKLKVMKSFTGDFTETVTIPHPNSDETNITVSMIRYDVEEDEGLGGMDVITLVAIKCELNIGQHNCSVILQEIASDTWISSQDLLRGNNISAHEDDGIEGAQRGAIKSSFMKALDTFIPGMYIPKLTDEIDYGEEKYVDRIIVMDKRAVFDIDDIVSEYRVNMGEYVSEDDEDEDIDNYISAEEEEEDDRYEQQYMPFIVEEYDDDEEYDEGYMIPQYEDEYGYDYDYE